MCPTGGIPNVAWKSAPSELYIGWPPHRSGAAIDFIQTRMLFWSAVKTHWVENGGIAKLIVPMSTMIPDTPETGLPLNVRIGCARGAVAYGPFGLPQCTGH